MDAQHPRDTAALLQAAGRGDPAAASELLPLVYDHLRELARKRLAHESPGQTLQPTALVHEAYIRIAGTDATWDSRRHFFAAAAIAMRRILVERARAKRGPKRGGGRERVGLSTAEGEAADRPPDEIDWIALDGAMTALEHEDPQLAEVAHLRYFAGLSVDETAAATGRSARGIDRDWKCARLWLLRRIRDPGAPDAR